MSIKTKARLIFLVMFLTMFACGALADRLGMRLGFPSLLYRNAMAVIGSYLSFLGMMWVYVRVIRRDPVFLRHAVAEGFAEGPKSRSGDWSSWGDWSGGDGWMVLVAVVALLLLMGLWIGIEGPALLIDEASAAAIAAGLSGRTIFLPDEFWLGRVLRRTILPAALYLVFSSILMGYVDRHCPGRFTLTQVVKECVMGGGGR